MWNSSTLFKAMALNAAASLALSVDAANAVTCNAYDGGSRPVTLADVAQMIVTSAEQGDAAARSIVQILPGLVSSGQFSPFGPMHLPERSDLGERVQAWLDLIAGANAHQNPSLGAATAAIVQVHQEKSLEAASLRRFRSPRFAPMAKIFLASETFKIHDPELFRSGTELVFSNGGNWNPSAPLPGEIYLSGGDLNSCLANAVISIVFAAARNGNENLRLHVLEDLTYSSSRTLSDVAPAVRADVRENWFSNIVKFRIGSSWSSRLIRAENSGGAYRLTTSDGRSVDVTVVFE